MINRLPWRKKLRTSAANNLEKLNEVIDFINHSDISPVTLSDGATGRIVDAGIASSMKALDVYGESVQDGVPSPDAPVPVEVVGLLWWNQLNNNSGTTNTTGLTLTKGDDGSITLDGTSTGGVIYLMSAFALTSGHKYLIKGCPNGGSQQNYYIGFSGSVVDTGNGGIATAPNTEFVRLRMDIAAGIVFSNTKFYPQVFDLTAMFGAGNEPETVEEFESLFPNAHYPYDAGSQMGRIWLDIDGELTAIDMDGNGLASLPDGTRDVLHVDSAGRVWIEERIGKLSLNVSNMNNAETYPGWKVNEIRNIMPNVNANVPSNDVLTSIGSSGIVVNTQFTNNILYLSRTVYNMTQSQWMEQYPDLVIDFFIKRTDPTEIELGYITPPGVPSGAVISIDANLNPEFAIEWWSYQDITDIIEDLKRYVDWMVSQVEGASRSSVLGRFDTKPEIELKPLEGLEPVGEIEEREEAAEEAAEEVAEEVAEEESEGE